MRSEKQFFKWAFPLGSATNSKEPTTKANPKPSFSSYPEGCGSEKLAVSDMGFVLIGDERIDVRGLHDIVSKRQLDTLGFMLRKLETTNWDHKVDLERRVDELYEKIEAEGLDILYSSYFTTTERFLDLPRKQELYALVNRMRKINIVKNC